MLKISKQVDYALQFLAAVSQLKTGDCLSVNRFAQESRLSFLFLQKIVRQLKQDGLVASLHGPRGGYRLTRPLLAISLLEVIEAVEGKYGITACTRSKGCVKDGRCAVEHKFKDLNRTITRQLEAVSVADFSSI